MTISRSTPDARQELLAAYQAGEPTAKQADRLRRHRRILARLARSAGQATQSFHRRRVHPTFSITSRRFP